MGAGERHQAGPVSTLTEAAVKRTTKVSHQTAARVRTKPRPVEVTREGFLEEVTCKVEWITG